jgi:predicted AAA+ superfamily ATPase
MGMAQTTIRRYLSLLQTTFLYEPLQPWSGGIEGRLVRTPKVMLNDPGIIAHLTGATLERLAFDIPRAGSLLESFVVSELRRQRAWAETSVEVAFFRTHGGIEVDVVLEAADGRVAAIDVKAAATIGPADFKGLTHLRDALGERFVRGVLLHLGEQSLPFGERLSAAPVDTLWRTGSRRSE